MEDWPYDSAEPCTTPSEAEWDIYLHSPPNLGRLIREAQQAAEYSGRTIDEQEAADIVLEHRARRFARRMANRNPNMTIAQFESYFLQSLFWFAQNYVKSVRTREFRERRRAELEELWRELGDSVSFSPEQSDALRKAWQDLPLRHKMAVATWLRNQDPADPGQRRRNSRALDLLASLTYAHYAAGDGDGAMGPVALERLIRATFEEDDAREFVISRILWGKHRTGDKQRQRLADLCLRLDHVTSPLREQSLPALPEEHARIIRLLFFPPAKIGQLAVALGVTPQEALVASRKALAALRVLCQLYTKAHPSNGQGRLEITRKSALLPPEQKLLIHLHLLNKPPMTLEAIAQRGLGSGKPKSLNELKHLLLEAAQTMLS